MKIIKTKKYAAMDKSADTYENIVFMQEGDAEDAMKILEDKGPEAAINYLAEWHYPGEHETSEELGAGGDDYQHENGGYILNWNLRIPYIGLSYRVPD